MATQTATPTPARTATRTEPGCTRCRIAFLRHDAFQCGYCTPGQLCSAAGMLTERGPSAVTEDLTADPPLTPGEIRERMSGNLCRCGAYVNIVRAIAATAAAGTE